MAGQVAGEPAVSAEVEQPKVPFLLRRSGEVRVLQSPLSVEQARGRFDLYLGAGKRRQDLARVQGRTVVARRVDGQVELRSYRRYLLGVATTAYSVLQEAPDGGTRALVSLSSLRYWRIYTVGLLMAGIIAILIFAPASSLWMQALLALGVMLVISNWRLSRATRTTVEEKRFLTEFVRNLLDAEEIEEPKKRGGRVTESTTMRRRLD